MTFGGGEPLLYPDAVYAVMQAATELRIPRRQVITNGYFSSDISKMREVASRLYECGVNDLLLSVDAFHQEFIPLDTVKVFAAEIKRCGISMRLQPAYLVSATDDNPYNQRTREILESFADMDIPIGEGNVVFPEGNALKYLAKKYLRETGADHNDIELAISTYITDVSEDIMALRERYKKVYEYYKAQTDAEKEQVIAAGGLCIIGTERHESRRIDNQLRGRAGRQGDIGMSVFYLSLEDDLMRLFGGERISTLMDTLKVEEDMPLENSMLSHTIENAQKKKEGMNFAIRKNVLQYDDVMNEQRNLIYSQRKKVLDGEDISASIMKMIDDIIEGGVDVINLQDRVNGVDWIGSKFRKKEVDTNG